MRDADLLWRWIGREFRAARRRLAAADLEIARIVRMVSLGLPPGTVIGQDPAPGIRVRASWVKVVLWVTVRPAEGASPSDARGG